MQSDSQKLSVSEKVGYSLGDAAANFVFMTMILFQANFYTDVMGIAVGTAGWLLLVPRVWDAFFDPVMGIAADRTRTRWGRLPSVDSVHGAALGRRDVPGLPDAAGLEHARRSSPTRSSRTCC